MSPIQSELLAARERTGDTRIAVNVEQGRFRVARIHNQAGGRCRVEELTPALTLSDAINYLREIR